VKDHGVEFFFILPYEAPEQQDELRFVPTVKKADVFFNVDTTGSMGGVITSLKSGLSTIITTTRTRVTDSAFGVAQFQGLSRHPVRKLRRHAIHALVGADRGHHGRPERDESIDARRR
jgi:hypothetical protein